MVHKISLIGQRFRKLLVIRELPRRPGDLQVRYLCQCDCGNTVETDAACLRGGKGSCGCIRKEKSERKRLRDLEIERLRTLKKEDKVSYYKLRLIKKINLLKKVNGSDTHLLHKDDSHTKMR